jgi:hypothetical protein
MFRFFSTILLISFIGNLYAQVNNSDMVLLRNKQGRTIKSYFKGMPIDFGDKGKREVTGIVRKINNDTIFIQQYDIRRAYNQWGTSVLDTVTSYLIKYNYKEITWVRKPSAKFEFVRDGTLFMIGGSAYLLLHVVNAAYLHQPVIGSTVAIAGGIAVTGFIMHRLRKKRYVIGNNYKMVYIDM